MTHLSPSTESRARVSSFPEEYVRTGPDTLGGKYLRLFWHPVARSEDVMPGRAKQIRILSENLTLYRGESGTAHITQQRCPHRRTQLSVGWVEGDGIRCLYHGWKFGADGQCLERPAEPDGSHGTVRIRTYPTKEFLGLIYGYFGDNDPPPFPPYPAFEGEGVPESMSAPFPCNYFQSWENDFDIYHVMYTHRTGEIHGPTDSSRADHFLRMALAEKWEETEYGLVRTMPRMGGGGVNAAVCLLPATIRLHIPTFNEQARFPGPRFRPTYLVHTPVDDENHVVFITQIVPIAGQEAENYRTLYKQLMEQRKSRPRPLDLAAHVFAGNKTLEDFKDYHLLVEIEDLLTQVGQGAIVDRSEERLGRSDAGVVMLRRLWARELEALRAGRPTKRWAFMSKLPHGLTEAPFIAESKA